MSKLAIIELYRGNSKYIDITPLSDETGKPLIMGDEDKVIFAVNLSHVTINGTEYRDMLLRNYWEDSDGWHIVISEITPQERYEARINSKIDYIAMIEDIEL